MLPATAPPLTDLWMMAGRRDPCITGRLQSELCPTPRSSPSKPSPPRTPALSGSLPSLCSVRPSPRTATCRPKTPNPTSRQSSSPGRTDPCSREAPRQASEVPPFSSPPPHSPSQPRPWHYHDILKRSPAVLPDRPAHHSLKKVWGYTSSSSQCPPKALGTRLRQLWTEIRASASLNQRKRKPFLILNGTRNYILEKNEGGKERTTRGRQRDDSFPLQDLFAQPSQHSRHYEKSHSLRRRQTPPPVLCGRQISMSQPQPMPARALSSGRVRRHFPKWQAAPIFARVTRRSPPGIWLCQCAC